ncbi:hypothetical protein LUX29_18150 [Aureimonas altamirensis]|uniref:hypothetical protein n=1 Tax=Aureimonas altamirensis TaxID=370622 RepID=UPI001E4A1706|nr:hypothetical protein [Aureimonas altamirensis]UHD44926.1 hypothetical protein LUX29_18150 [Aureimonas altamirensis]
MHDGWTRELVLEQLIEAFEVDDALPIRVGPKAYGNAMPDVIREARDEFTAGGAAYRAANEQKAAIALRRSRITSAAISRAEASFSWVPRFVPTLDLREVLFAYAAVKARGQDWGKFIQRRNRRKPQSDAWIRRTTYRHMWRAAQAIADGLNNAAEPLPNGVSGQVTHIPSETASEPIRWFRSWEDEGALRNRADDPARA